MSELKNEIVLNASNDIVKYLYDSFGIEVDELDIAELINLRLRTILNIITGGIEK